MKSSERRDPRQRHGDGEGEQPVAQPVGELAAQHRAGDIAQREHRQRDGEFEQGHVIGHLHEGGEVDRPRGRSRSRSATPVLNRPNTRGESAAFNDGRAALPRVWPALPRPTVK